MSEQNFAAAQYTPRAPDYVTSAVHAQGPDLDQIEALVTGHAGAVVLDLGCGGGHVSYRAAPHVARVVAVDVTPAMLEQVQKTAALKGLGNIETRQAPAEHLPFANAVFDVVLCRFTAHHWQDFAAGLREARRVLKPGGLAVFIDTVAPAPRVLDTHLQAMELLRDASHVRNYSVPEWVAELARAGFMVQGTTLRRLRMEFPIWIARTQAPPELAAAIRQLQSGAPEDVRAHFAIGEDGSFNVESATFVLGAG
ncbi:MAG: class I SAM-dependent methyltransferase [Acidocella sp.]|uniref:class I SAM-dependent methyltransferase n=1 Tax=Acidocella sp. TaxID=50710 RepID=UPI003FC4CA53